MCNSHDADDREALNQDGRRGFLKAGAAAGAGVALAGATATANAAVEDYDDPKEPALPPSDMTLDLSRTALVVIDPQVDFLSPDGVTWGVVGESVTEHGTVGNICLLYTSPSPRDLSTSRMPSSA